MCAKENGAPLASYCYSDMAAELYKAASAKEGTGDITEKTDGLLLRKEERDGIETEILRVENESASAAIGKSVGTYYTVHTGKLWLHSQKTYGACVNALRTALVSAIGELLPDFCIPREAAKGGSASHGDGSYGDAHTGIDFPLLDPSSPLEEDMIDPIGADAVVRTSVSPEWNQGSDIYHRRNATGNVDDDFSSDAEHTCITEIPPEPLAQTPLMSEPHGGALEPRGDAARTPQQKRMSVLVVGLGNPELTPDALGTMCVRNLNVTRHLDGAILSLTEGEDIPFHALSAFCPMVLGQTGIETLALVQGAVRAVKPDLVILLDALAASETASLFSTVQIATTGIHPGGGIGNKREPLTRETLGVPTLTVGTPTVISAATMLYRALDDGALLPHAENERLTTTLDSLSSCFVSPKDADIAQREYARLIAYALSEAVLGPSLTAEWFRRI